MTPEAQRIAIAEACGWTDIHQCTCKIVPRGSYKQDGVIKSEHIPDYLNDLNAMHEAEKVLTRDQACDFVNELAHATNSRAFIESLHSLSRLIHATAAQRAEAFLRTIGKWEDDK